MLVLPGMSDDLLNLGCGDVLWKGTALSTSFRVDLEHDTRRAFAVHRKKTLQYAHDEIHRREIVVEQKHLVHARRTDSRLFRLQQRIVLFPDSHGSHSNRALWDGKPAFDWCVTDGLSQKSRIASGAVRGGACVCKNSIKTVCNGLIENGFRCCGSDAVAAHEKSFKGSA